MCVAFAAVAPNVLLLVPNPPQPPSPPSFQSSIYGPLSPLRAHLALYREEEQDNRNCVLCIVQACPLACVPAVQHKRRRQKSAAHNIVCVCVCKWCSLSSS